MKPRHLIIMLVCLFPASRIKNSALRILGWKIGSGARISSVIAMRLPYVNIGARAHIQQFSIFRDVSLEIGEASIIGKWNWLSAARPLRFLPDYKGIFKLGCNSAINSRNYFDVTGGISFGNFSDLAGVRSTFITHQINLESNQQTCSPIEIGEYVIICSNSTFVPGGIFIGDKCVIAMGSVVIRGTYAPNSLFAGNPAKFKKYTSGSWFQRIKGPAGS